MKIHYALNGGWGSPKTRCNRWTDDVKLTDNKSKVTCKQCLKKQKQQDMQQTLFPHKEWWQNKNASQRYALMKKYSVKSVTDKLIKRMYYGEAENELKQQYD